MGSCCEERLRWRKCEERKLGGGVPWGGEERAKSGKYVPALVAETRRDKYLAIPKVLNACDLPNLKAKWLEDR